MERFPWPDHHPPPLSLFRIMVEGAKEWYEADERNVIVIHCKVSNFEYFFSWSFFLPRCFDLSISLRCPSTLGWERKVSVQFTLHSRTEPQAHFSPRLQQIRDFRNLDPHGPLRSPFSSLFFLKTRLETRRRFLQSERRRRRYRRSRRFDGSNDYQRLT